MQDLPAVVPLLVYRDIVRAHEFLVRAFGFEPGLIERTPDGDVVHGEMKAGGQVTWLHQVIEDDGWVSQLSSPEHYGVREYGARDVERRRWAFVTPLR